MEHHKSSTLFVEASQNLSWLPIFNSHHPRIHQPSRNPPLPTCSGLPWSYKDTPSPRHYRAMHSIGVQGEHGLETKTVKCMSDWILELWFYRLKDELNVLNVPSRMIGESWHPFWLLAVPTVESCWVKQAAPALADLWVPIRASLCAKGKREPRTHFLRRSNRKQTTDFNRWMVSAIVLVHPYIQIQFMHSRSFGTQYQHVFFWLFLVYPLQAPSRLPLNGGGSASPTNELPPIMFPASQRHSHCGGGSTGKVEVLISLRKKNMHFLRWWFQVIPPPYSLFPVFMSLACLPYPHDASALDDYGATHEAVVASLAQEVKVKRSGKDPSNLCQPCHSAKRWRTACPCSLSRSYHPSSSQIMWFRWETLNMEDGERRAHPLPSCLYLFSKTCTTIQKDVKTSLMALSFTVSHPSQASCSQAVIPAAVVGHSQRFRLFGG